jgi:uncharacterized SAM-binding protein YcdF (DUF218 family)
MGLAQVHGQLLNMGAALRSPRLRWILWSVAIGSLLAACWGSRAYLLRSVGMALVAEDELQRADVIYVLGGASVERGREAAKLYRQGWAQRVVFTGSNVPNVLAIYGMQRSEAGTSFDMAVRAGLPPEQGELLEEGTSTMEEQRAILTHARANAYQRVIICTTRFHTGRVRRVFGGALTTHGIALLVHGTPADAYDEGTWWNTEEGLIACTNEYLKSAYYWWRY